MPVGGFIVACLGLLVSSWQTATAQQAAATAQQAASVKAESELRAKATESALSRERIVELFSSSHAPALSDDAGKRFVERPAHTKQVTKYLADAGDDYLVVMGPRGCGKSALINHALANVDRPVVQLQIGGASDLNASCKTCVRALGGNADHIDTYNDFVKLLAELPHTPVGKPVVLIDVNIATSSATVLKNISTFAKALTMDSEVAYCIIVLSDAGAVFGLANDPQRQRALWVDDLTRVEAHEFWNKRGFLLGEASMCRREVFFSRCGTRAALLTQAVNRTDSELETVMAEYEMDAATSLKDLITVKGHTAEESGPAFGKLVKKMLESPKLGVPQEEADEFLVAPDLSTAVLKRYHALLFHIPTHSYQFYSVAHHLAAEKWANGLTAVALGIDCKPHLSCSSCQYFSS